MKNFEAEATIHYSKLINLLQSRKHSGI